MQATPGEPSVSIIIPCFNYGRFLAEAIESVLGQTHVPLEVIVIDDGSTDDSRDVASRYVPSVELLTQPNQGLVSVLNRGVHEARGDYFVILSADDVLRPSYVETLLAALLSRPEAAYAYSEMEYFGAKTGVFPAKPFSPALLLAGNYINATALTRRADALAVGGPSPIRGTRGRTGTSGCAYSNPGGTEYRARSLCSDTGAIRRRAEIPHLAGARSRPCALSRPCIPTCTGGVRTSCVRLSCSRRS